VLADFILLNRIVKYVGDSNNRDYVESIALTKILASVLTNQGILNLMLMSNSKLSEVSPLIDLNCLSFSILQSDDHNEGLITNSIQVETLMLSNFGFLMNCFITIPVELIVALTLIGSYAAFLPLLAGIFVKILMLIASISATLKIMRCQKVVMQKRDTTLKSTTEMVNGIKVIKMGGMEDEFFDRVNQKRDEELNLLKKQYDPYIFTIFCTNATPLSSPQLSLSGAS
jgi:ABC-type multidrug transport system fused ATPase/permease subunit